MSTNEVIGSIDILDTFQTGESGKVTVQVGAGVANTATYDFTVEATVGGQVTDSYSDSGYLGDLENLTVDVQMDVGDAQPGDVVDFQMVGTLDHVEQSDFASHTIEQWSSRGGNGGGNGDGDGGNGGKESGGLLTARNIAIGGVLAGVGIAMRDN